MNPAPSSISYAGSDHSDVRYPRKWRPLRLLTVVGDGFGLRCRSLSLRGWRTSTGNSDALCCVFGALPEVTDRRTVKDDQASEAVIALRHQCRARALLGRKAGSPCPHGVIRDLHSGASCGHATSWAAKDVADPSLQDPRKRSTSCRGYP